MGSAVGYYLLIRDHKHVEKGGSGESMFLAANSTAEAEAGECERQWMEVDSRGPDGGALRPPTANIILDS